MSASAAPTAPIPCNQNPRHLPPPKTDCKLNPPSTRRSPLSSTHLSIEFPPLQPQTPAQISPNYTSLIESCNSTQFARQLHAHGLKRAFGGRREFLETRLVLMYGRCGGVNVARLLFERMPVRTIYSWAGILTVCTDHRRFEKALLLFQELLGDGAETEFFIFPVVLKACSGLGALETGKELHGLVLKMGFASNVYVGNALIDMYGKCMVLEDAVKVLKGMPERDRVSWNSMISGCAVNGMVFEASEFLENMWLSGNIEPDLISWSAAIAAFAQNGYDGEALELLRRMIESGVKPNAQTLASVLPACGRLQALDAGEEIHGYITRHELMSNSFVVNGFIDVYRRCSDMGSARELFSRFSARNLVSYNTMIVGYCENSEPNKARELFDYMEADGVRRDAISWNSMISGYGDNGKFVEALKMFRDLQMEQGLETDTFTLGSVLTICTALAALRHGKEIHSYAISRGLHSNPFVGGALVEMYCKSQDLAAAEIVFHDIVERNTVTWNLLVSGYARANRVSCYHDLLSSMRKDGFDPNIYTWNGLIAGCMENGHNELALQMTHELQTSGLTPDIFTVGMILPICSRMLSIERGKQVHAYSIRCGYDIDVHIGAALVDMYAKCGSIEHAILTFYRISQHNVVSFNSMLSGFAMHGLKSDGLALFDRMLEDAVSPDEITFLSVLSLCVHGGSVEEGIQYFDLMQDYDVTPDLKHYTCMIDLFSRAGQLSEARELIRNMPMEPDAVVWGALLGGCVVHRNVELGEIAANRLLELEEDNVGDYVLIANLYAVTGRLGDLSRTRQIIKNRGMHKSPGCSWIEGRGQVHVFLAGDRSHELTDEIYDAVDKLDSHMREDYYMVVAY